MNEKLEELISLLYQDKLTQYGKRLLVENIEKLQKENEELKNQEATARRINELLVQRYSNSIPIQKVKEKIRKNEEIIDISNDGDLIHELLQKNKVYEELLESEE